MRGLKTADRKPGAFHRASTKSFVAHIIVSEACFENRCAAEHITFSLSQACHFVHNENRTHSSRMRHDVINENFKRLMCVSDHSLTRKFFLEAQVISRSCHPGLG